MESKDNLFLHNINFLPIPEKLKSLLVFIAFRCQKGIFKQSDGKIAGVFGVTDRSIRSRIQELHLSGWIKINNPGDPKNRTIELCSATQEIIQMNSQILIDKAEEIFLLKSSEHGRNLPINTEEIFLLTRKKTSTKAEEIFLQNNNKKNNIEKNIEKGFHEIIPESTNSKNELKLEERISKATKKIAEFFSISELRQPKHYMTIGNFVRYHANKGDLDFLADQFTAYKEIKSKDPKYKHNWYNYIGSPEKSYQDGTWNLKNWVEEIMDEKPQVDQKYFQALKKTQELLNEN